MNWQKRLEEDLTEYRPITFWSWNGKLESARLCQQIEEIKQAGMGGFFMHARSGLKTEYLGKDWFSAVDVCVEEAEKQGVQAWVYDENGWPSGFAGRKLLDEVENLAHFLSFKQVDAYDPSALANYVLQENRLVHLHESDSVCSTVYAVYDHVSPSVVDILNEKVVRKFLDFTHEVYAKRYGKALGQKILGFFTDEPQYYREATPYSPTLAEHYYTLYGEDLLDRLGALFIDCENNTSFRWRYWKLLNDLVTTSFAKQIYEWCEAHGCQLTGHAIEESALHCQMWCCAGVMPFYEYEHIPGCDWLGRNISSELTPRQVSSVAQQLGKKRVLTESFACTGWDVTPAELKKIVDWQYVNGVNMLCTHLTPYSLEGSRKYDHPAFFSSVNPWFEKFPIFANYIAKLGCMLSESQELVEVGVIHPMHSAYLTYNRVTDADSVRTLNQDFKQLIERLGSAQIPHHYLDENLLAKYGSVEGATLCLGACRYHSIVLPAMQQIDATTCTLLRDFLKNGGKLWLAGEHPSYQNGEKADLTYLISTVSFEELQNNICYAEQTNTAIRSTYRLSDKGDFLFAVNLGTQEQSITFHIHAPGAAVLNLQTGETEPIAFETEQGGICIPLTMAAGESRIILMGTYAAEESCSLTSTVTFSEPVMQNSTANSFVIDQVRLSYDGVHFSEKMPIVCASEQLLNEGENRDIWLEYSFVVRECPPIICMECESMNAMEWRINGHLVSPKSPGRLGADFLTADIRPYVQIGENTVRLRLHYRQSPYVFEVIRKRDQVTEGILNSLTIDTEIDSLFLHGDFIVQSNDPIEKTPEGIFVDPSALVLAASASEPMDDLTKNGYPFFAGEMTFLLTAEVEGDGDLHLLLDGRYGAVHLCWNEFECDVVLSKRLTIPKEYVRKFNRVSVTLYSGNRNLLGPFHWAKAAEPQTVFPNMFTMNGKWQNGQCSLYREKMALVPFGAKLTIL